MARRLGVGTADLEDVVQETFARAAIFWHRFVDPVDMPLRTARRRWIARIVLNITRELRRSIRNRREHETQESEHPVETVGIESHEALISAQELLQRLELTTTPQRWRIWVAYEVDGVESAEICRQEGIPLSTVHNLLRLAREDMAAALGRDAASALGPGVPRNNWRTVKRRT